MSQINTDNLGFSKTLVKSSLFSPIQELYNPLQTTLSNAATQSVRPSVIRSGAMIGNISVVEGYLKSNNFYSGVNGWKFDAVGNLEANSAVIRGSIYATAGLIGDWVIDTDGFYYNGSGTPNIRTGATVGSGSDGVIIDKDGVRCYDSVLGVVVNLPSDGSAPSFASGTINETTFEISTNAVLRTSSTVGDGSADSAGVLINNTGFYACEAGQNLGDANVRITNDGAGYFKGTVSASNIVSSAIYGSDIYGATITGGLFRTAETGRRLEMDSTGISLLSGNESATYNTFKYNEGIYGSGALAYINNESRKVPFYIESEQNVADFHFYNRSDVPSGAAEIGDVCVVGAKLMICIIAGTPGVWQEVGTQTGSRSPSVSPSASPS